MSYSIGIIFFGKNSIFTWIFFSCILNASDIALIKLPSPVEFDYGIQPAPLACTSAPGMEMFAIGNGVSTIFGTPSTLQYTVLQITKQEPDEIYINGLQLNSIAPGDSGD